MTKDQHDTEFTKKVKRCFTANIWYLIVGVVILVFVATYIVLNPIFNWGICISLILAICLIVYAGLTIVKCVSHLQIEATSASLQDSNNHD